MNMGSTLRISTWCSTLFSRPVGALVPGPVDLLRVEALRAAWAPGAEALALAGVLVVEPAKEGDLYQRIYIFSSF